MAKKRRRRRKKGFTLPLAPIAGLSAGMIEPLNALMGGNWEHALAVLSYNYTGYNPEDRSFNIMRLQRGLLPLIIGGLVHKYVGGTLGINRALAASGVPIVRI